MRRRECVKSLLAVPAAVAASSTIGLRSAAAAFQELPSDGESYWNHLRWEFLIPEGQAYFNTATLGASPRAGVSLLVASKARALLDGRTFVTPDDVKQIGSDVLRHRVLVTYEAEAEDITSDDIVKKIFDQVEVP